MQGTLDLLILKVVALEPIHGYAIAQRLPQIFAGGSPGPIVSLYPALYRLEERSLIQAEWRQSDQGRVAKFYRITRKGTRQLEAGQAEWERTAAAIALVFQTGS